MEVESHSKLSVKDFPQICRICLANENLNLFDQDNLREIFKKLSSIDVSEDDEELPNKICKICIGKLDDILYFADLAKINDSTLKEILKRNEYAYSPAEFGASDNESLVDEPDLVKVRPEEAEEYPEVIKVEFVDNDVDDSSKTEGKEKSSGKPKRNKIKGVTCKICKEKFNTAKELRRHQSQNEDCAPRKRETKCQTCNEEFGTVKALREHQKQSETCKETKNKCTICERTFEATYKLREHLRTHTNETPYECKICGKKFKFAQNLRRHDNISHKGIKPFKCDICGKEFDHAEALKMHTNEHENSFYLCEICNTEYTEHELYADHLWKAHDVVVMEETPDLITKEMKTESDTEEQYIIELVDEPEFARESAPDSSMESAPHSSSDSFSSPDSPPPRSPAKGKQHEYECDTCKKTYNSKPALRFHQSTHSSKNIVCSICGKKFWNLSNLKLHQRIHTGVKPYKCEECGKRFRQPTDYKRHVIVHTGERSFKCEICDKTFKQSQHLNSHYKIHSGEKSYVCQFCGKAFAFNSTLKVHTRIHTGEKPFVCDICNSSFYDSSSLCRHKRKEHI